jgi:guanylate kinase
MASGIDETDSVMLSHALKRARGEKPIAWDGLEHDRDVLAAALGKGPSLPTAHPQMLVMCGPSGCGKSTIKDDVLDKLGIGSHMSIDPDVTRTVLEARGVQFNKRDHTRNKDPGQVMSSVTNTYNERLMDHVMTWKKGKRPSIVLDTTGQNFGQLPKLMETAKVAGYRVTFVAVYASWEQCKTRIEGRNAELTEENKRLAEMGLPPGRRLLPLDIAKRIYDGFMNEKAKPNSKGGSVAMYLVGYPGILEKNVAEIRLYDNDQAAEGAHTLLYHTLDGEVVGPIVPFLFYDVRIQEEEPHLVLVKRGGRRRARGTRRSRPKRRSRTRRKTQRN